MPLHYFNRQVGYILLSQNKLETRSWMTVLVGKELWKDCILFSLSFILTRTSILNGMHPFGPAFLATILLGSYSPFTVLLGCTFGTVSPSLMNSLYQVIPIYILYGMIWFLQKKKRKVTRNGTAILLTFSMMISVAIRMLLSSVLLYDVISYFAEILLVILAYYIFLSIVPSLLNPTKRRIFSNEEMISISLFMAIITLGVSGLYLGSVSISNTMAVFIILLLSYMGGAGIGAGCGLTFGLVLSLGTHIDPFLIGNLGICGLLAGTFREFHRFGSCIGFILANAIVTFYINRSTTVILPFSETALASVLFIMFPKTAVTFCKQFIEGSLQRGGEQQYYFNRLRNVTVGRLKEFSEVFSQMSHVFGKIVENRRKLNQEDISQLFDIITSRVCTQCALKNICWKKEFYNTYHDLFDMLNISENKGYLEKSDLPQSLLYKCMNVDNLLHVMNEIFDIYHSDIKWQGRIDESRILVGQQLQGVAKVINELAAELNVDVQFKKEVEQSIREELDKAGIRIREVIVQEDQQGRSEVHVIWENCGGKRECRRKFDGIISSCVGKRMACKKDGCNAAYKSNCTLIFNEAMQYDVMTGVARQAKDGNGKISGDSYSFHGLKDGKYMLILADGMGTGSRAAEESATAISLLEHFYDAGFSQELIFRTINSILILRSSDEIFSTADLCILDLVDGYAEFVKIGAVSSYMKKGERTETIRASSLPIGILEELHTETIKRPIQDGDFIIMMSDGVTDTIGAIELVDDWMAELLNGLQTQNPQEIAELILQNSFDHIQQKKAQDDMTVMVTRIWDRHE